MSRATLRSCDCLQISFIDCQCILKDLPVALKGQHFHGLCHREISPVEEALLIGNMKALILSHHRKPLDSVADFLAAAFGEEVIAGVACDADDFRVDASFILDAPERDVVGTVVIADYALGHDPVAAIAHQQKDIVSEKDHAAGTAANCTCQA